MEDWATVLDTFQSILSNSILFSFSVQGFPRNARYLAALSRNYIASFNNVLKVCAESLFTSRATFCRLCFHVFRSFLDS